MHVSEELITLAVETLVAATSTVEHSNLKGSLSTGLQEGVVETRRSIGQETNDTEVDHAFRCEKKRERGGEYLLIKC